MKKFKIIITLLMSFAILSCSQDEQAIDEVFDNLTFGAVLRTTNQNTTSLNLLDPSSVFSATLEEIDNEDGDLLQEVNVFVSLTDVSTDNGFTPPSEGLIRNIPRSEFGVSRFGFPEVDFSFTFAQALTTMGLVQDDVFGGDFIVFRLELVLTDGRTFTSNQASGTVSQSFLASPFQYPLILICEVETPFSGDYRLNMVDNYGDGWQTAFITVTIDGVGTDYSVCDLWGANPCGGAAGDPIYSNIDVIVNVPEGSTSLEFEFSIGSCCAGEVEYEIFGPSGNTLTGYQGPAPNVGPIAVNLCRESN